jgi:hypothetical protein
MRSRLLPLLAVVTVLTAACTATAQPNLRHFDNGTFSFDYPAEWRDLREAAQPTSAIVLGTGSFCSGEPGSGCGEYAIQIPGKSIVLQVWTADMQGPGYCADPAPTGPVWQEFTESTLQATQPTTRWEIRRPGYVFGAGGNAWVEAVTSDSASLAQARDLIASFHWDTSSCVTPAVSAPVAEGRYDNGNFSFDYPATWKVLAGAYYEGLAFRTDVVLGTGEWHSGCVTQDNGGSCTGDKVNVGGGRVVVKLFQRTGGPAVFECGPDANATLGPNAVMKGTDQGATTWEIRRPGSGFGFANNEFIQAWTDDAGAIAQVEALVASFRWKDPIPTATCGPMPT